MTIGSRLQTQNLSADLFVDELQGTLTELLGRLAPEATLRADDPKLDIQALLRVALKNELEATEIAARWIPLTDDPEIKLAFARQVGDESKHYRLIRDRLSELGADLTGFNPLAKGFSPLFTYLDKLKDTVERVAAGQFAREGIALIKNAQFIALCEARGDSKTAALYRDTINADERYHHELGDRILRRLASTPEAREQAREAVLGTLKLAEELQSLALDKLGVHHAPGC
jgi:uncharacterized ferritin-like protein (DUF455 family)